jgi:hemerythrin
MAFFPWSDDYLVHVRVIDNDHKDLVQIVNNLHDSIKAGSSRAEIGRIIASLATYVSEHFEREEGLMEEYDYPGLTGHKRMHRRLARTVHAIRKLFGEDPRQIDPAKLLNFLKEWLVHHILEEDVAYVPYLQGTASGEHHESAGAAGSGANGEAGPEADDDEEISLSLNIPSRHAATLRRCARILAEDSAEAIAIEDIVIPLGNITHDEAIRLAHPVLK